MLIDRDPFARLLLSVEAEGDDGAGGGDDDAAGDDGEDTASSDADDESVAGEDMTDGDGNESNDSGEDTAEAQLEVSWPEGMEVGDDLKEQYTAFAKENGLTSEQASAVAAYQHQLNERATEVAEAQESAWKDEVAKDPKYGGDQYATTVQNARAGVAWLSEKAGVDLGKALDDIQVSEYPDLVRGMAALGSFLAEDNSGGGGSGTGGRMTKAEKLRAFYDKSQGD